MKVTDIINNIYGIFTSRRMVSRYVQPNKIGQSPSKREPDGGIPKEQMKT